MKEKEPKKAVGAKDDILLLEPKYFGPFWEYVDNDDITDVDFNGTDLWITDTKNRRTKIEDHGITANFIEAFSQRVANQVSKPFNKMNNLLEAETKTLRISILHESAAVSGRSVCLRKTLPTVRLTPKGIVEDAYMPRPIMNLLANCIKVKMNFVIGGEPGAGKDLADSTPVPVPVSRKYPSGWARHGDLQPGDRVYAMDGTIADIDYVTEGRDLDLYEVEFSDGQVIKASDTHLWDTVAVRDLTDKQLESVFERSVYSDKEYQRLKDLAASYTASDSQAVATAGTIAEAIWSITSEQKERQITMAAEAAHLPCTYPEGTGGPKTWPLDEAILAWADFSAFEGRAGWLRTTEELYAEVAEKGAYYMGILLPPAIEGPKADLPMDPYHLGVCLALEFRMLGHEKGQYGNLAYAADVHPESAGLIPEGFEALWDDLCRTLPFLPGSDRILDLRIPPVYLRASKEQRLELLQGFVDVNRGHIGPDIRIRCRNVNLCRDVVELARSLGMRSSFCRSRNIMDKFETGLGGYEVSFLPGADWLEEHVPDPDMKPAPRLGTCFHYITAVRKVPSEHGKCIHIKHPSHLYLADGFVPTHNTECAKFFTQFVPLTQRVITIEDSPEWHYHTINPYHDCVEMRVNPDFDYAKAIKTCLRQNPKWIMLSEARSTEVKYLIESWSTGVNGVTTVHTDDVRKIPSRLLNMMASRDDADRLENDIYDFVNVVMLVRRKQLLDGTAHRYIDQMGFLYRDGEANLVHLLVKNGELVSDLLPPDIAFRLDREGIKDPFECEDLDAQMGDVYRYRPMEHPKPLNGAKAHGVAAPKQADMGTAPEPEPREPAAVPVPKAPVPASAPGPAARPRNLGGILGKRGGVNRHADE